MPRVSPSEPGERPQVRAHFFASSSNRSPGRRDGRLRIEIEDNGVGISEEKMPHVYVEGIGLSNVRERLRVLYGADFRSRSTATPSRARSSALIYPNLVPQCRRLDRYRNSRRRQKPILKNF
jgi:hypothetical protein